jgi:hypothetical protein
MIRQISISVDGVPTVSMHPLSHCWINIREDQDKRVDSTRKGLCIVSLSYHNSKKPQRYFNTMRIHISTLLDQCMSPIVKAHLDCKMVQLYTQIGWYLHTVESFRTLNRFLDFAFKGLGVKANQPTKKSLPLHMTKARTPGPRDSITILKGIIEVQEVTLEKDNPKLLASQSELACAELEYGLIGDAIALYEQVIHNSMTTWGEEHPERLAYQRGLARAFLAGGRAKEFIALLRHVIQLQEVMLDEKHPDRLATQHELTRALLADNQMYKAID